MTAIATTDIKDLKFKDLDDLSSYITAADTELNDLAAVLEVDEDDISDPVHYRVTKWLVAWVCMEISRDYMGKDNQQIFESTGEAMDPYEEKYKVYKKLEGERRALITPQILKDDADEKEEFAYQSTQMIRTS